MAKIPRADSISSFQPYKHGLVFTPNRVTETLFINPDIYKVDVAGTDKLYSDINSYVPGTPVFWKLLLEMWLSQKVPSAPELPNTAAMDLLDQVVTNAVLTTAAGSSVMPEIRASVAAAIAQIRTMALAQNTFSSQGVMQAFQNALAAAGITGSAAAKEIMNLTTTYAMAAKGVSLVSEGLTETLDAPRGTTTDILTSYQMALSSATPGNLTSVLMNHMTLGGYTTEIIGAGLSELTIGNLAALANMGVLQMNTSVFNDMFVPSGNYQVVATGASVNPTWTVPSHMLPPCSWAELVEILLTYLQTSLVNVNRTDGLTELLATHLATYATGSPVNAVLANEAAAMIADIENVLKRVLRMRLLNQAAQRQTPVIGSILTPAQMTEIESGASPFLAHAIGYEQRQSVIDTFLPITVVYVVLEEVVHQASKYDTTDYDSEQKSALLAIAQARTLFLIKRSGDTIIADDESAVTLPNWETVVGAPSVENYQRTNMPEWKKTGHTADVQRSRVRRRTETLMGLMAVYLPTTIPDEAKSQISAGRDKMLFEMVAIGLDPSPVIPVTPDMVYDVAARRLRVTQSGDYQISVVQRNEITVPLYDAFSHIADASVYMEEAQWRTMTENNANTQITMTHVGSPATSVIRGYYTEGHITEIVKAADPVVFLPQLNSTTGPILQIVPQTAVDREHLIPEGAVRLPAIYQRGGSMDALVMEKLAMVFPTDPEAFLADIIAKGIVQVDNAGRARTLRPVDPATEGYLLNRTYNQLQFNYQPDRILPIQRTGTSLLVDVAALAEAPVVTTDPLENQASADQQMFDPLSQAIASDTSAANQTIQPQTGAVIQQQTTPIQPQGEDVPIDLQNPSASI